MADSSHNKKRTRVVNEAFQCRRALEVYAYSMLRDRVEAEDLVQETFLVVMEKYDDFEEGTSMLAWTRAIVRLKVLQMLDKRKRRAKVLDRLLYDAIDAAYEGVDSDEYTDEMRARYLSLEYCLGKLADKPRRLLDCVYTEKLSYEQTATAVGMKYEAVKKSLQRAKAQLRECIQRNAGNPNPKTA